MSVSLVGAGPGDPGLLTRRGAELLSRADVVVYDRLIGRQLLELAPPGAELIDVGKGPGGAARQPEINQQLIEQGRSGRHVVRLKGGDPFVFGRGGEEAEALRAAGVDYEVVPGVSSGFGRPGGRRHPGHPPRAGHVGDRGHGPGRRHLGPGRRRLGRPRPDRRDPGHPHGHVRTGADRHRADGRRPGAGHAGRRCPLGDDARPTGGPHDPGRAGHRRPARSRRHRGRPGGGAGPRLDRPRSGTGPGPRIRSGVSAAPLRGRRVVITRARSQRSALADRLAGLGATVVELPVIDIEDPPDGGAALSAAADRLVAGSYRWVALTSSNAVSRLLAALGNRVVPTGVRWAAVGTGTARTLTDGGFPPELVPEVSVSDALAEAFPEAARDDRRSRPGAAVGPGAVLFPGPSGYAARWARASGPRGGRSTKSWPTARWPVAPTRTR